MYKRSQLIRITDIDGNVTYGVPNHIPIQNWDDWTLVDESEIEDDFEENLEDTCFVGRSG